MSADSAATVVQPPAPPPPPDGAQPGTMRTRRARSRSSLLATGEPMIWLTGGSLVVCVTMIIALLLLILWFGLRTFQSLDIARVTTFDGNVYMGEVTRREQYRPEPDALAGLPPAIAAKARAEMDANDGQLGRRLIRTGNFRLTNAHFQWVEDFTITRAEHPEWAITIERMEWGRFYGFPEAFAYITPIDPTDVDGARRSLDQRKDEARQLLRDFTPTRGGTTKLLMTAPVNGTMQRALLPPDQIDAARDIHGVAEVIEGEREVWAHFQSNHQQVRDLWQRRRSLEKHDTGRVNSQQEAARLDLRQAELDLQAIKQAHGTESAEYAEARPRFDEAQAEYDEVRSWADTEFARIRSEIQQINHQNRRYQLLMATAGEGAIPAQQKLLPLDTIVRAVPANQLSASSRLGVYLSRWWEFLADDPREANQEGGVFPAIFGTVLMTVLLAVGVVPFGVLAALYLREYAKAGTIVSAVRIAINNLAGVPSIVFGVFGLGFFCYMVGGYIDGGPEGAGFAVMPRLTWFVLLASLAAGACGAGLMTFLSRTRPGRRATLTERIMRYAAVFVWISCATSMVVLVAVTPFFDGFYQARLADGNPTFGKGALIWGSATLALLTLPVVIVATEEALSAVPNSMREGSYACGASKWQTIKRIVLPRAMPGIMTGMILAMARGAGEVAPLMLVGAVKLAPELPFTWSPPFGVNRSFMHLGFHIYDVGFQSPNSEAAKPMVFTTTLLLILIIAVLNIAAIYMRTRLRRRFIGSQF